MDFMFLSAQTPLGCADSAIHTHTGRHLPIMPRNRFVAKEAFSSSSPGAAVFRSVPVAPRGLGRYDPIQAAQMTWDSGM